EAVAVQPIARALYEREVAIVGFEPGIETGELATFLGLLSKDPRRASAASIGDELKTAGVRNIYVEAMDFSHIGLEPDATVADSKLRREIWDLILGGLVAGRQLSEDGSELDQENRRRLDELSALLAEALGGTSEDF